MSTKCFLLTRMHVVQVTLTRYRRDHCPVHGASGHMATTHLDEEPETIGIAETSDPRWPTRCECGEKLTQDDRHTSSSAHWWSDGQGNRFLLARRGAHAAPPGAMWDADWYHNWAEMCGTDGRSIVVRLPNMDDWCIDSRASNCTMPDDTVHKCWVRHGEMPTITVDKDGHTCAAGAGSIQSSDWHGFLRNGELVEA